MKKSTRKKDDVFLLIISIILIDGRPMNKFNLIFRVTRGRVFEKREVMEWEKAATR